jgi:hypothetical protein
MMMSKATMSEAVMTEVTPEPVMMTGAVMAEAVAPVSPSAACVAWHSGDEKESDR